jgi:hypothetical protein
MAPGRNFARIASGRLAGVLARPSVEGPLHQLLIAETGSTFQMRPVVELTGPTGIGWTEIGTVYRDLHAEHGVELVIGYGSQRLNRVNA